ncbi:glycoside hydrolase family 92 protein, partial [Tyzzerella nexilis]|nr:glycoside hydrolase family 92 protein [[Clostridium] nexile]
IDVESQDTAKANRFYTALYRRSFLPHELSDVGELQYGDFAMWDTYRAQLPLYHLLTPMLSGEMMPSLVKMYQDGV